jgi:hypothetical protein
MAEVCMLEPLEPYYRRFRKRLFEDASPWARDNIIWGIVVLVVPPIAAYLRNPHAPIDWDLVRNSLILYAFAFMVYILAYLRLIPKRLDDDRASREDSLTQQLKEQQEAFRRFASKPLEEERQESLVLDYMKRTHPAIAYVLNEISDAVNLTMPDVRRALERLELKGSVWSVPFDALGGKSWFLDETER